MLLFGFLSYTLVKANRLAKDGNGCCSRMMLQTLLRLPPLGRPAPRTGKVPAEGTPTLKSC